MKIEIDYKLAHSIAQDQGNRNMKANGRTSWNEEDWNIAAKTMNDLLDRRENHELDRTCQTG